MKYTKFKLYKSIFVVILAIIAASFVLNGNYVIPLVVLIIGLGLMFFLKSKVKEVLTDERIEKIGGKASRITLIIATFGMAIAGLVLVSLRTKYPEFLITGYTLSYITCGMLILYAILFKFYNLK